MNSNPQNPLMFDGRNVPPEPLNEEEEALLAFAAAGITGYALGDLPYPGETSLRTTNQGTTILGQLIGRTAPSGDALNSVLVFIMNDEGTWVMRRPQDLKDEELKASAKLVHAGQFVEAYRLLRRKVLDHRVTVPGTPPFSLPFNNWTANQPGTTYFLPVSEVSTLYINSLLWAFGNQVGYYVVDERNPLHPHAPLCRFRISKGGHLHDDPADNKIHSIGIAEAIMYEFTALEQGAVLQNLGLMAQALGLGGFPHYAAHPYAWFEGLGFKMDTIKYSESIGNDFFVRPLLWLTGAPDIAVPTAVGFADSWGLLQPFCPPNWPTMSDAVNAYAAEKFSDSQGHLRDPDDTPWRKERVESILRGIPAYSDDAMRATIAYCEYVHRRYRTFPAHGGPFRTELAFQAHHIDPRFYEKYYRPEALSDTQRQHWHTWHPEHPFAAESAPPSTDER
jgi:hypothetical protein